MIINNLSFNTAIQRKQDLINNELKNYTYEECKNVVGDLYMQILKLEQKKKFHHKLSKKDKKESKYVN